MIGKIYKIVHNQSKCCYVGSTFQSLKNRWQGHKNLLATTAITPFLKEHGIDNFKIMLIKEYEVVDRQHLEAYEQLWISKLSTVQQSNTIKITKLSNKHHKFNNKDDIKEYNSDYKKANRSTISDYNANYNQNNKEQIKQRRQAYYQQNKAVINSRYNNLILCECGKEHTVRNKSRHLKTKFHLDCI